MDGFKIDCSTPATSERSVRLAKREIVVQPTDFRAASSLPGVVERDISDESLDVRISLEPAKKVGESGSATGKPRFLAQFCGETMGLMYFACTYSSVSSPYSMASAGGNGLPPPSFGDPPPGDGAEKARPVVERQGGLQVVITRALSADQGPWAPTAETTKSFPQTRTTKKKTISRRRA
eukprot:TRINITY_DN37090_c0_g1_i1.p1 TRINITY_DN37090_c0_g1~~TRINITY_DN37090_c0_g1_i1.p1  ORF type:complete len:179 (-),score=23.97 TRINITY_DN37090_c0_g1_i1:85-621(-)